MQVQVRTDNHVVESAKLTRQVEAVKENAISDFGDRVTRVEVYLSDENSGQKSAENDNRCVMQARLAGLQPIVVSHQGTFLDQAIDGATAKLENILKRMLGRPDN
jgi:hypothetical protein